MKHLLLLSVLLLGCAWVAAQDTTTPSQPPSSGSSQAGSSQSGSASSSQTGGSESASGQMSAGSHKNAVEGCLSGSDGKYTLTDKQGTTYQLTGDTSKLAEHVGHEVKINGSAGAGSATSASAGASQTLEVKSIKHVSKTCQSGGMGK